MFIPFVSLSNIRISTPTSSVAWVFNDVPCSEVASVAVERKSCITVSRRTCGSTGRTQGIPAGAVNGRNAMPGFRSGREGPESENDDEEDKIGASIGAKVSCGVLGGEWESARM